MHYDLGGYQPGNMEVVAAFDIDQRKVGKPIAEAIYALPNCTQKIVDQVSNCKTRVSMGPVLDGVSEHLRDYPRAKDLWSPRKHPAMWKGSCAKRCGNPPDSIFPWGRTAARFTAECCLNTGVSLVNCMPVLIASDRDWGRRLADRESRRWETT